tara:strand:- start:409 stop:864 length:456 start_codon:yes stop_codon:yes gene_type:complete
MKIKIEMGNRFAIVEALNEAYSLRDKQGLGKPEKITSRDILDLSQRALYRMSELRVSERVGARASFLPGPISRESSTQGWDLFVGIECFETGWFLTKLSPVSLSWRKGRGYGPEGHTVVSLPKHAYNLIKDRRMEGLTIAGEPENTKGESE